MNREELFGGLDEEELEEETKEESSEKKFKENFSNLDIDIAHIDNKLRNIQQHLTKIESNIINIENAIQRANNNPNSTQDIGKLYAVMNKSYELLSFFQKTYHQYLDLKFRHRNEQNELKYKLMRMDEIEKKRLNEFEGVNNLEIISALDKMIKGNPDKQKDAISEIEKDPKYQL